MPPTPLNEKLQFEFDPSIIWASDLFLLLPFILSYVGLVGDTLP